MNRRGFLGAILAAGVAPAAIGSGVLMPVKRIVTPDRNFYHNLVRWADDFMAGASPIVVNSLPPELMHGELGVIEGMRFITSAYIVDSAGKRFSPFSEPKRVKRDDRLIMVVHPEESEAWLEVLRGDVKRPA